jgi:hypothetical protein
MNNKHKVVAALGRRLNCCYSTFGTFQRLLVQDGLVWQFDLSYQIKNTPHQQLIGIRLLNHQYPFLAYQAQ